MSWNYPEGMSRADLIHVGEIEDPDDPPEWFDELINDEWAGDVEFLWKEFRKHASAVGNYINVESAANWLSEYYSSAFNGEAA